MNGVDFGTQRQEAERWLAVAERDLRGAGLGLEALPPEPEIAAYHCQQAAETIIKGLLTASATPFRKTDDLDLLADLCARPWPELREGCDRCRPLTIWHSAFRYPQPGDESAQPPTAPEVADVSAHLDAFLSAARAAVARPSAR